MQNKSLEWDTLDNEQHNSKLHSWFSFTTLKTILLLQSMLVEGFSCDLVSPANQSSHVLSAILPYFCETAWNNTHAITKNPTTGNHELEIVKIRHNYTDILKCKVEKKKRKKGRAYIENYAGISTTHDRPWSSTHSSEYFYPPDLVYYIHQRLGVRGSVCHD